MYRLIPVMVFLATAGVLSAQQLSLPFASPPYGKNGNIGIALEVTPTIDALKSGALGLSMSVEGAPKHTSKYSVKGDFAYYQMTTQNLFGSDSLIASLVGTSITTNIVDFMFLMRIYPSAQSINTFFVGLGMGATVFITSYSGSSSSIFASLGTNTVFQPQIQFETGYKFRVIRNFFIEPSANYKLSLPAPGLSFSANIPIYTFLTSSDSGPLSGIELAVSAGVEF